MLWRHADTLPFSEPSEGTAPVAQLERRRHGDVALAAPGARLASGPRLDVMADLVLCIGDDGRTRHVRGEPCLACRFRKPLHEHRFLFRGINGLDGYRVGALSRSGHVDGDAPEDVLALLREARFLPVDEGPLVRNVPSILVRATRSSDC